MKTLMSVMLVALTAIGAHDASAAPPLNVVGSWSVKGNGTSGTLSIRYQGYAGVCRQISGDAVFAGAVSSNAIEGFYCPSTGRIHFVVMAVLDDIPRPAQSWLGNVGDDQATDHMGGTFVASTPFGGLYGEYSFQAEKP